MKKLIAILALVASFAASARTFDLTVWRGETLAARVPDSCELGTEPAGLKIRAGLILPVPYSPEPDSLDRRLKLDRVIFGDTVPMPREVEGMLGERVVEVTAPADAKPGVYACGMLRVKVLDRVLPPAKEWQYYLDLWQHPWAVAHQAGVKPFSKEHYAKMRPVWELLASAGQKTLTVTILEEPWDHQCCDAYHSMVDDKDFKLFDEYVEFGRSCGLGPDISCYSLCPWKLKEKPGTPEFEKRWAPFMQRFAKHLKEKGWYKDTIMAMDEREPEQVKAIVDFVHKYAPGMRISMAGNRKPSDFQGIDIDVYAQILNDVTPEFLAECPDRRAKGFKTTFYVCCAPTWPNTFLTSKDYEAFWLGAYPAFCGLDGFLRWAWNSWPRNPVADASYGDWRAGDTFLVYPNAEPSWRFLMLRNGIIAAEKVRVLREKGLFADEIAKTAKVFDLKKAVSGKEDCWVVRKAVLELVNHE